METIKNIFGTYIRIIRINSNISQENLVRELNLLGLNTTQTVISRIENGTRELYDYELYCICKVLNIDIKLFFDKDLISKIPKKHNPLNIKK